METLQTTRLPRIGATFPQTEIGADPAAIRDYAQAVEEMGFDHIVVYDHVVGANVNRPDRQGRRWAYTSATQFHEPFVLYGFFAAVTKRVGLVTGIIILPQRQTVLVAKQAAAVDVLSGGRPRPAGGRADPPAAPALDPATGDVRRQVGLRARRRHQPAAGSATDPDLDRRGADAGQRNRADLAPHRPAERRLDP